MLSEQKLIDLYYAATGQALRIQDRVLAFAFARAIEAELCVAPPAVPVPEPEKRRKPGRPPKTPTVEASV